MSSENDRLKADRVSETISSLESDLYLGRLEANRDTLNGKLPIVPKKSLNIHKYWKVQEDK